MEANENAADVFSVHKERIAALEKQIAEMKVKMKFLEQELGTHDREWGWAWAVYKEDLKQKESLKKG